MAPDPDRAIAGEVTRVEAVEVLNGVTGHAVASVTLVAVGAIVEWTIGRSQIAFVLLVGAWLVSINGLSLFGWDRIRAYVESRAGDGDAAREEQTLKVPVLSVEHKAELLGGLVQMVVLVAIVLGSVELFRRFGPGTGSYLLGGVIAVGNLGALLVVHR